MRSYIRPGLTRWAIQGTTIVPIVVEEISGNVIWTTHAAPLNGEERNFPITGRKAESGQRFLSFEKATTAFYEDDFLDLYPDYVSAHDAAIESFSSVFDAQLEFIHAHLKPSNDTRP